MNAKTLSAAMSLILSLAALSANAAETRIVDLPTVTVRPDAALAAELAANEAPRVAHIVDLAAINVYPTAEQLAERAAIVAAEHAQALTAQLATTLLAETLAVTLP